MIENKINGKKYLLGAELGRGSFGVVCKCIQLGTKKEFALKFSDYNHCQKSLQEIGLMSTIHHPFIAQYEDFFFADMNTKYNTTYKYVV